MIYDIKSIDGKTGDVTKNIKHESTPTMLDDAHIFVNSFPNYNSLTAPKFYHSVKQEPDGTFTHTVSNAPIFEEGSILETIYNYVISKNYCEIRKTTEDDNGITRELYFDICTNLFSVYANEEVTEILTKNLRKRRALAKYELESFLRCVFDNDYNVKVKKKSIIVSLGADSWPFVDKFVVGD